MNFIPPNSSFYPPQPQVQPQQPQQQQQQPPVPGFPPPATATSIPIYEPYEADEALASQALYADSAYYDDGQEHGDNKRRRIARACEGCRRKKIRCNGEKPCMHCLASKTDCVFTTREKKRAPPKGAKYIESLENRLGRMESLLRLSGLLHDSDDEDEAPDLQVIENRLTQRQARLRNVAEAQNDPSSPVEAGEQAQATSLAQAPSPLLSISSLPVSSAALSTTQSLPALASGLVSSSSVLPSATASLPASAPPSSANVFTAPSATGRPRAKKAVTQAPEQDVDEALSSAMDALVTTRCGDTRYIGSSSGFSIFSPKGIQWINSKTGDTAFQDMIISATLEDNKLAQWRPDVFQDIFRRKVYQPLPSKQDTLTLLRDFFTHFNCMFPLYSEPSFMALAEKHYSKSPPEGSGWWASLNVALAISHRLREMTGISPAEDERKAWAYLKNALAVLTELTMRNTDMLSIQALLGISVYLMGTPNPQPSFFLVAAAIRLAHSVGLHKKPPAAMDVKDPAELLQRDRVFWIAYMLDKDVSLRSGRPPAMDDEDTNQELPSKDPPDNIGDIPLADGKGKVNIFRLICEFAKIAGRVYKRLYSVRASKQSDGALLNAIGGLDKELEDWKNSIPLDFRPEYEIKAAHTPLMLHVVVLHFGYYNCLTTIHRMSVHHGYWTNRLSNHALQGRNVRPLNPRVFSSAQLCVNAARTSINLLRHIPAGDYSSAWMIIYFPISAHVTLFANALQNPTDIRAQADLTLMSKVVDFLSLLCQDDNNTAVRRIRDICAEFERISRIVIERPTRRPIRTAAQSDTEAGQSPRSGPANPNRLVGTAGTGATLRPTPVQDGKKVQRSRSQPLPSPGAVLPAMPLDDAPPLSGGSQPANTQQVLNGGFSATTGLDLSAGLAQPAAPPPPPSFGFGFSLEDPMSLQAVRPPVLPGMPPQSAVEVPTASLGSTLESYMQYPFVPHDVWQMPMSLDFNWSEDVNPFLNPNFNNTNFPNRQS